MSLASPFMFEQHVHSDELSDDDSENMDSLQRSSRFRTFRRHTDSASSRSFPNNS